MSVDRRPNPDDTNAAWQWSVSRVEPMRTIPTGRDRDRTRPDRDRRLGLKKARALFINTPPITCMQQRAARILNVGIVVRRSITYAYGTNVTANLTHHARPASGGSASGKNGDEPNDESNQIDNGTHNGTNADHFVLHRYAIDTDYPQGLVKGPVGLASRGTPGACLTRPRSRHSITIR
ncbi:hypothetical protein THAOC_19338 [Thalassiosira oceanica]|uniref:Uncharacterized protein n=1 Tax=Thalassiosira oceanica TaxID=159749 RepID=K0SPI0_THAOC|nr:hypothetical protein THAOC_19338 [Thalassiosira oceanica]|eukprot:EJK60327.1 hypothetical protein THAOC_19338 [Thalassiosira oceanica]